MIQITKREIIVPPEKIETIKNFAEESAPYHKDIDHPRTLNERELDICIGKIGEEILYETLSPYFNISRVKYDIFTNGKGDSGIDFNINNFITIDNKTIFKRFHIMRLIHSTKCMWYSLVHLNDSLPAGVHGGTYIGMITLEELLKHQEWDSRYNCKYVEERVFKELNNCHVSL